MSPKRRRPFPDRPRPESLYPTLDLHGETAEGARRRAEGWLRAQRGGGERVVRLITGRGRHSAGPPVLPGEIEDLLRSLHGSLVSHFEVEPGGGVYRVELRHRREHRPTRTAPRGEYEPDPELRRRAEEALAELGVSPDPVLLAAEMRRLRRERDQ